MVRPAAIGIGADNRDLVGQGRVVQRQCDAVVMRAHVERVLMRERNVDGGAGGDAFGQRGYPGLAAAGRVAHRIAEYGGQHRYAVFLLAVHADQRGLAVALRLVRTEQRDGHGGNLAADRDAGVGERAQVWLVAAGERIVDHRHSLDPAQWRLGRRTRFLAHDVDKGQDTLDEHTIPRGRPAAAYVDRADDDKGSVEAKHGRNQAIWLYRAAL